MERINITEVEVGAEEERLVLSVLRSGQLAQGPMVEALEEAFCLLVGTRHAVAVSSGTTALVTTLEALGLEPGDEVITSPFTFAATLNAIIEAGAVARFADIGPDFNMLPDATEALIGPRTRAIVPVHLYGYPADMLAIVGIAERFGLAVVEDAAQAIGASVQGRSVGSFGAGCFSLYATKNVTSGEGGVITTDDADLANRLRILRNQGMRGRYDYVVPGHNHRLTDLQAAVGVAQMGRLEQVTATRKGNARALSSGLRGIGGLELPSADAGRTHVYHQYTVRVTSEAPFGRDRVVEEMDRRGIGTGVYYPRVVFDYPCYLEHPRVRADDVPNALAAARSVLSLPVHPRLSSDDLDRITTAARGMLER